MRNANAVSNFGVPGPLDFLRDKNRRRGNSPAVPVVVTCVARLYSGPNRCWKSNPDGPTRPPPERLGFPGRPVAELGFLQSVQRRT